MVGGEELRGSSLDPGALLGQRTDREPISQIGHTRFGALSADAFSNKKRSDEVSTCVV
ncbi:hypothetical protein MPLB_1820026 [Mesorhizobium sp. ORS 3324]|nr:hypothetical protein MPLB_1820026 [Mesorhizobium sp. ORS 3324]